MVPEKPSSEGIDSSQPIFAGITVLEDASWVSGPYCGKLLADLGATVIKIECRSGDPARFVGPPVDESDWAGDGPLFTYCNANKESITLELDSDVGRGIFYDLLDQADVVISDRRASGLSLLGLLPDAVTKRWPSLVFVSVTPFGLTGPDSDRAGYELDVFHSAGEGRLLPGGLGYQLFPDRPPLKAGRWLPDYDAGLTAAIAATAALYQRAATGYGDFVEISHREAEVSVGRANISAQLNDQMPLSRAHRGYDFGGIFRCKDGYFTVRPNEDRHWEALAQALEIPGLGEDERFATRAGRQNNGQELNLIIARWGGDRTMREIYELLAPSGSPVAFFASPADVLDSPQLLARDYFVPLEEDGKTLMFPSASYRMSEGSWQIRRPPPRMGEDNERVYGGIGISLNRLRTLRKSGAI